MTEQPKILAFTGSLRKESVNKKVLDIAIEGAVKSQGDVSFISLKDYPLPLYDQDIEEKEGIPENAKILKSILRNHDGLMIASPEYNSSYSAVLKNVIDWTSRPESSDEPMFDCYRGKVAAIMSASPGVLGGLRGLSQLRFLLENIFVFVIPQQQALPSAFAAFDEEGNLKDEVLQEAFKGLGSHLVNVTRKLLA